MHTKTYYRLVDYLKKTGINWDKLAPKKESAIEFAHTYINPEPERWIDQSHHYSLEYCLACSGETINDRFRNDAPDPIDIKIADMVASHKNDVPLVLYRGVCEIVYDEMKKNAENIDGIDFYEKGFMQTSLVKGCEINSKIKLRIYVPAGTNVVYLGNVNYEQKFYEVDIQRGAKLRVVSMDETYINCKIVS